LTSKGWSGFAGGRIGDIIEVAHEGYRDYQTPRFARALRVRLDLRVSNLDAARLQ
jgi:hypothetical protein